MKRRDFIKKSGAVAAVGAASALAAPAVIAQSKVHNWKMVSTWPPQFPVIQTGLDRFAKRLEEATQGRIKVRVYAGGELVPPLQTFEAVSQGTVEMGSGAAYYWAGTIPASQWFGAVPFGFNSLGMNSWLRSGGGMELWREAYAPHGVIPFMQMNTGPQAAGWFNREIKSLDDFKGLKFRIPGLGGKIYSKLGVSVVLLPGGEIVPALEKGVVDAVEWVGPEYDMRLGLHKVAKYFYYPGIQEPGTLIELIVNKKAYESLPDELKHIVDSVTAETYLWSEAENCRLNAEALDKLIRESKIIPQFYPEQVTEGLRKVATEVLEEEAAKDPTAKKVHESFKKHMALIGPWIGLAEKAYYEKLLDKKYSAQYK